MNARYSYGETGITVIMQPVRIFNLSGAAFLMPAIQMSIKKVNFEILIRDRGERAGSIRFRENDHNWGSVRQNFKKKDFFFQQCPKTDPVEVSATSL